MNSGSQLIDSSFWSLKPHSQISNTRHPAAYSCIFTWISRCLLTANFFIQNSGLVFGVVAYLHPSWRCQKQPWTKMHNLYLGKTRSGLPGRIVTCNRYLKPCAYRNLRMISSGCVFFPLIPDIMQERVLRSTISIDFFPFSSLPGILDTIKSTDTYDE